MGYRNIVIEGSADISCKNKQLVVYSDGRHSVPLEDLNAILLESRQSSITVAALSELTSANVAVFVCDEKHLPNGVLFPFAQHSRQLKIIKLQEQITLPVKKRLWQQIIQAKIKNQALCAKYCLLDDVADYLDKLSVKVTSGDNTHLEATAAGFYFRKIFGEAFSRNDEFDGRNSGLNYGYAILRGNIARLLATYGFFPSYGIYHRSELNAFNLADDILEPFRPVVDLFVAENIKEDDLLTPQTKHKLFNLLNVDIDSGGQMHSVAYAGERTIKSLSRCLADYENNRLLLPNLVKLRQHGYE